MRDDINMHSGDIKLSCSSMMHAINLSYYLAIAIQSLWEVSYMANEVSMGEDVLGTGD